MGESEIHREVTFATEHTCKLCKSGDISIVAGL